MTLSSFLLGAFIAIFSCRALGAESLEYQIQFNYKNLQAPLSIRAEFEVASGDILEVTGSFGEMSELSLIKSIKAYSEDNAPLKILPAKTQSQWQISWKSSESHPKTSERNLPSPSAREKKKIHLEYEIHLSEAKESFMKAGSLAVPNFFKNAVTFRPAFCLVRPALQEHPKDFSVRLRYELPKGWASAGMLQSQGSFDKFSNSYQLIYREEAFQKKSEGEVDFFLEKEGEELLPELAKVFGEEQKYFKADPKLGRYLVIVISAPAYGGEAGFRSLLVAHRESQVGPLMGGRNTLTQTLSHEFFHLWEQEKANPAFEQKGSRGNQPEKGGDFRWFSEGFTDYFSYYFLAQAKILSLSEFAKILEESQKEVEMEYHQKKRPSLLNASKNFFLDFSSRRVSYLQGMLVALQLDYRLGVKSQFKKSLLDFYSFFMNDLDSKDSNNPRNKRRDYLAFKRALDLYQDGATAHIAPFIEETADPILKEIFIGFGGTPILSKEYRLGAMTNAQEVPICVKELPPRLKKMGLKNGDCIIELEGKSFSSRQALFAFQNRPVPATVLRQGRKFYLNLKLMPIEVAHWKFDSNCTVWNKCQKTDGK